MFRNNLLKGRYDFKENEVETIMTIANSCPFINGPAVYEARSLANYINPELYFDDYTLCTNVVSPRKRNPFGNSNILSASIFPNPASERLNIELNSLEDFGGELIIYNILGSVALSLKFTSPDELNEIDIALLPNGIYSCVVKSNEVSHAIGKLTIINY